MKMTWKLQALVLTLLLAMLCVVAGSAENVNFTLTLTEQEGWLGAADTWIYITTPVLP